MGKFNDAMNEEMAAQSALNNPPKETQAPEHAMVKTAVPEASSAINSMYADREADSAKKMGTIKSTATKSSPAGGRMEDGPELTKLYEKANAAGTNAK